MTHEDDDFGREYSKHDLVQVIERGPHLGLSGKILHTIRNGGYKVQLEGDFGVVELPEASLCSIQK